MFTTYCFFRDIPEGHLSIEKADNKQSNFANELKNLGKDFFKSFCKWLRIVIGAREKVFNSFESRLFSIKNLDLTHDPATEPEVATKATKAKTKCKTSSLKLREEFLNKIKNEKNVDEQTFKD